MKKIYMLAAALIGLNGCVAYPDDYQDVYYADQAYVTSPYATQTTYVTQGNAATYIVQESVPSVVYVEQPTYFYAHHYGYAPRRPIHTPPHLHRRPEAPHHHHAAPKHHDSPKPHNGKHHK